MPEQVGTLIIGGGIMGCALAFWLTRMDPGHDVLVVEQDPRHLRSSTALSLASIRQQFTNQVNVRISRFGIEVLRDLEAVLGPTARGCDPGLRENGYLLLSGSEAGSAVLREAALMQRAEGAGTVLLDPGQIAARYPWLDLDGVALGSLNTQGEGWFDSMGLLTASLASRATARGLPRPNWPKADEPALAGWQTALEPRPPS
jgi:FAD-dependent oxidoreductase domain-containing protein 1